MNAGETEYPASVACYAKCPMFPGMADIWCERAKLAATRKPQVGDILATPQQDEDGCARRLFA